MSEAKRPGGLTALAVINFIFCAFELLSALGAVFLAVFIDKVDEGSTEDGNNMRQAIEDAGGMEWIWASAAASSILAVLLLMAGIGYLQQKRFLGRTVGTAYALLALAFYFTYAGFGRFDFSLLIDIVYPALTLLMLNLMFKDDLVN
ncbi:MAG: hypothetical protein O2894_10435 [Planctomycetota bacterium]|nr:hypothetical protein [Planctomycetota bacterium]